MKIATLPAALGFAVLGACAIPSAMAQNISLTINQPGIYGRVNIGEPVPQRAWVNPRPIIIEQPRVVYERQPIYLYVPSAHSGNWGRYCGNYNACTQPVIFVQDDWVRDPGNQRRYGNYRDRRDRDGDNDRGHNGRGRARDRDGDGVRNSRDFDRDGDGVRNDRDRAPNNPNRR